jgi:hypothetical protein
LSNTMDTVALVMPAWPCLYTSSCRLLARTWERRGSEGQGRSERPLHAATACARRAAAAAGGCRVRLCCAAGAPAAGSGCPARSRWSPGCWTCPSRSGPSRH